MPPQYPDSTEAVNAFNEKYPIGTPVIVHEGDRYIESVTSSTASVIPDGRGVVGVAGVSDVYEIDRVKIVGEEDADPIEDPIEDPVEESIDNSGGATGDATPAAN